LDIETESINLRGCNQRSAYAHAKSFETTLRVPKRKTRRHTDDQIEDATSLFASPWLMNANQAAIKSARSKSQIDFTTANRIDELRRLSDWGRKVRIGEKRDVCLGL